MESVGAVGIAYFLDSSDQERNELGDQWERRVLESLLELKDLYAPDLEVSQRTEERNRLLFMINFCNGNYISDANMRNSSTAGRNFCLKYSCLGNGAFEAVNNRDSLSQHHPYGRVQLCGIIDG